MLTFARSQSGVCEEDSRKMLGRCQKESVWLLKASPDRLDAGGKGAACVHGNTQAFELGRH